ncbi:hypothetical protein FRB96_007372 [Tulasnella sp. 330]|nr:hypothetical protein FRB96_007372 [Tulasnella sp. 330]
MDAGMITRKFVGDLLTDPSTRNVTDVSHRIIAVASSSSIDKAQKFIHEVIGKNSTEVKACGNYEDLMKDPDVDIVYIATPASHHYSNILMCLEAGKHFMLAVTINSQQTGHVIKVARQKKLFLMEAVWTRFFPIVAPLTKILRSEAIIGQPLRLFADLSFQVQRLIPNGSPRWAHSLYDHTLGGGALLHLGMYCVVWACIALMDDPRNCGEMPKVVASMVKTKREDGVSDDADGWKGEVDEHTSIVLTFEKTGSVAILTTGLALKTPKHTGLVIQGEKGTITAGSPAHPDSFTIDIHGKDPETHEYKIPPGHGLHLEADACARAIRDGKTEAEECSLDASLTVMRIMDEVRKQGGLKFQDDIESVRAGA